MFKVGRLLWTPLSNMKMCSSIQILQYKDEERMHVEEVGVDGWVKQIFLPRRPLFRLPPKVNTDSLSD